MYGLLAAFTAGTARRTVPFNLLKLRFHQIGIFVGGLENLISSLRCDATEE